VLKGYFKGNVLDVKYVGVEIPEASTVKDTFTVWFQTPYEVPPDVRVDAEVELGGVKCLACNGSGRVALNAWPVSSSLKDTLKRITRMEQTFVPPVYTTPLPPEGE
jgi:hypothetical protein